jgi:thiosulfate dehydrogenase
MYDSWWTAIDVDEPTGDHPLWATQSTNERTGPDTYRCKECHGWDYRGADGAYGSGSHFTGFTGVLGSSNKSTDELTTALTTGDHDFSELGDEALTALVAFLQEGMADYGQFIDADSKTIIGGDLDNGEDRFQGTCAACHGTDGRTLNFGSDEEPVYVGTLALDNPWETFHKARFGHPGSDPEMPSTLDLGWSIQDVRDVIAYAQTLPTE